MDNETDSDSLLVQNLSLHTSLSVHCIDNEAQALPLLCTDKEAQYVPITRPGKNVLITRPPWANNGAPLYRHVPITRP